MKRLLALLVGLLIIGAVGYIQATPIGGAKIHLLDEDGKPLTDYGKVHYSIWTFNKNGSIKVLQKGTLTKNAFKSLLLSDNMVKLNLDTPRKIAGEKGSHTAFIGVDIWIEKEGKLYTFPPESFEVKVGKGTFAENIMLNF